MNRTWGLQGGQSQARTSILGAVSLLNFELPLKSRPHLPQAPTKTLLCFSLFDLTNWARPVFFPLQS